MRKNIQNIIHDNNLEPFMKDGKDNIFSVYFLDSQTKEPVLALLCHASTFADTFYNKEQYEDWIKELSEAFRILPINEANAFKSYIGMDLSDKLTTTFHNEKSFDILKPNSDPRDYAFRLHSNIDDKNNINITIYGLYKPISPITFDEQGNFIPPNTNPADSPSL